ncbi:hypothetical protein [Frankia sp. CiP3]|uniref:hypothetical protein n=1 Tax=Frankia sp. CiP3 TaxID=2880971 RepID=UPI001EF5FB14|nr:hypothetical protein [Frankia sp. CiP3]
MDQTGPMHQNGILFNDGDLMATLDGQVDALKKTVNAWNPDELLATAPTDVVNYLIGEYSVVCPTLRREEAELVPAPEVVERREGLWQSYEVLRTQIVIAVPFDGDRAVFKLRASRRSLRAQYATVTEHEIRLAMIADSAAIEPTEGRAQLDARLDRIDDHLGYARADIDRHNERIRQLTPELVTARRAKVLADRRLEAGLGFPIRQRPDAARYAVPVTRRRITVRRPIASGPFVPEPVLAESDYEAALAVLRSSRNALERNPSTAAKLDEEEIRDLLLISLNTVFEGNAAGEVFNGDGKTDILIREDDRNVFIGECKIWDGPSTIPQALDQLFSYLVWRDTKAALLLFIRRVDVTAAIGKAVIEVEKYPTFKRCGAQHTDERLDFVLHAKGDRNREIRLAVLPFALPRNG